MLKILIFIVYNKCNINKQKKIKNNKKICYKNNFKLFFVDGKILATFIKIKKIILQSFIKNLKHKTHLGY